MTAALTDTRLEELASRLHPIRSPRTFEAAVDQVVGLIEREQLGVGDRLPNLQQLAQALDISRPTAAQALRLLERSGVVKLVRGAAGGIYVTSDLIPMDVISAEVEVAEDALVGLLEARRVFEGAASHLAALRGTADDFAAVDHTIGLLERYRGDRAAAVQADGMFHRRVPSLSPDRARTQLYRWLSRARAEVAFRAPPEDGDAHDPGSTIMGTGSTGVFTSRR
jgi:GntR family transcriptional repressor for pyruvate dehydrogenase complex